MISLRRQSESNGRCYFMVECQGNSSNTAKAFSVKRRKFLCGSRGFEDAEARSRALQFACSTDTIKAFGAFLYTDTEGTEAGMGDAGHEGGAKQKLHSFICVRRNGFLGTRYAVVISPMEPDGGIRALSFFCRGEAVEASVKEAILFLRSRALERWRKGYRLEPLSRQDGSHSGSGSTIGAAVGERALKHECAFVEIEGGEKVDCVCGKNQSRGLMLACEQCGAWEHADCQGFRSDKQIPADYICSACERERREDVTILHTLEKGEDWERSAEDLRRAVASVRTKEKDWEAEEAVCSICGCEDNQDFEGMVHPCACQGGSALAHPSCLTAVGWNGPSPVSPRASSRQGSVLCHFCGGRGAAASGMLPPPLHVAVVSKSWEGKPMGINNSSAGSPNKLILRKVKDPHGKGTKRLRSSLVIGVAKEVKGIANCDKWSLEGREEKSRKEHGDGSKHARSDKVKVEPDDEGSRDQRLAESENSLPRNAGGGDTAMDLKPPVHLESPTNNQERADTAVTPEAKVPNGTSLDTNVPVLGRRFSDAVAASMPIKKRRLQLVELMRSVSPPARSSSLEQEHSGPHELQDHVHVNELQKEERQVDPGHESDVEGSRSGSGVGEKVDVDDGDTSMEDVADADDDGRKGDTTHDGEQEDEERSLEDHQTRNERLQESLQKSDVDDGNKDEGSIGKGEAEDSPDELVEAPEQSLPVDQEDTEPLVESSFGIEETVEKDGHGDDVIADVKTEDFERFKGEDSENGEEKVNETENLLRASTTKVLGLEAEHDGSGNNELNNALADVEGDDGKLRALGSDTSFHESARDDMVDAKWRNEEISELPATVVDTQHSPQALQGMDNDIRPADGKQDDDRGGYEGVAAGRADDNGQVEEEEDEIEKVDYDDSDISMNDEAGNAKEMEVNGDVEVDCRENAGRELIDGPHSAAHVRAEATCDNEGEIEQPLLEEDLDDEDMEEDRSWKRQNRGVRERGIAETGENEEQEKLSIDLEGHETVEPAYASELTMQKQVEEKDLECGVGTSSMGREASSQPDLDDENAEGRIDGGITVGIETGEGREVEDIGASERSADVMDDRRDAKNVQGLEQRAEVDGMDEEIEGLEADTKNGTGEENREIGEGSREGGAGNNELSPSEATEILEQSNVTMGTGTADNSASRNKNSGWDQLPDGFHRPEDALKAVQAGTLKLSRAGGGSASFGGAAGAAGGASGGGGGGGHRHVGGHRFGRGGHLRVDPPTGSDREDGWSGRGHPTWPRRLEDAELSPSPREVLGRGRERGFPGRSRGRADFPYADSPNMGAAPWGAPGRQDSQSIGRFPESPNFSPSSFRGGPANAAAMAAAKVESSGFMVGPDGTITKANGPRGPPPVGRMLPGFPAGGRGPAMFGMGRGPALGMGMGGMGLGMMRGVGLPGGMGMGMGPGLGLGIGLGMGVGSRLGMGIGPGGMAGPNVGPIGERFGGPPFGRGGSSQHVSGRHGRGSVGIEEADGWVPQHRSLSPISRGGRGSRGGNHALSPRHRSRSSSPRRSLSRTPRGGSPHLSEESGGGGCMGGGVGGRGRRRSQSPSSRRRETRGADGVRADDSPRRSIPPPKLPLPPPPPRTQRSPSATLKKLMEGDRERSNERERDKERGRERDREMEWEKERAKEREKERERESIKLKERDREFDRSVTIVRPRSGSRRLSPHIEEGSVLMDKRDRELLAALKAAVPGGERAPVREGPSHVDVSLEGGRRLRREEEAARIIGRNERSPRRVNARREEESLRGEMGRGEIRADVNTDDSGPRLRRGSPEGRK